jgi:hypothetical protein
MISIRKLEKKLIHSDVHFPPVQQKKFPHDGSPLCQILGVEANPMASLVP